MGRRERRRRRSAARRSSHNQGATRQRTTQSARRWRISILSILAVLGTFVTVFGYVQDHFFRATPQLRSHLKLVDFSVRDDAEVEITSESRIPVTEITHKTSRSGGLDITLLNTGPAASILTALEVDIKRADRLEDCRREGGEIRSSGNYEVKLPTPTKLGLPPDPQLLSVPLHREVPTGGPDRFTVAFGTAGDPTFGDATLYEVEVRVRHDKSDLPLILGAALLTDRLPPYDSFFRADQDKPGCVAKNRSRLMGILSRPGVRLGSVADLQRFVRAPVEPEPPWPIDCGASVPVTKRLEQYADYTGDGIDEAIILVRCERPTGPSEGYILVYDGSGESSRPKLLAKLDAGEPSLVSFSYTLNPPSIMTSGRSYSRNAPLCCPDLQVNAEWRWDGRQFLMVSRESRKA